MNIVLINHYAGSAEMGMEFRPYYFAREWVKMGHHVDIVAADYSHLRIRNPQVLKDFQTEVIDGITYHWIKAGRYEGNGVKRALTMFRFVGKLWWKADWMARKWKPDVVITSSTYPLDTYAGQRIAKKCKARLIHEVHDMWPATLVEIGGMSRFHPFVMLLQIAENSCYKHSDYVVSLPPFAKAYMVRHGLKPEKFVAIPNGIAVEDWEKPEALPEKHKRVLEKYKQDGKFIVGYFGGHARSNALDRLLDVAKEVSIQEIQFVLVGNGVEKERLVKRTRHEKITNVHFLPPVSKKAVPELLQYFDCSFISSLPSPLYRFGICLNKMYDSMMAGKPILCAIDVKGSPVEKYRCGIKVKENQTDKIVQEIEALFSLSKEEREQMGNRGKQAVLKNFSYDILAERFQCLFNENSNKKAIWEIARK